MADEKQLHEELLSTWHELKNVLETQNKDAGETKAVISKLNERLDAIETKLNRPPVAPETKTGEKSLEVKAFTSWLRKGIVAPDEAKALATDDQTDGGYLVPSQMRSTIIELLAEYSPIRSLASVETISLGNTLKIPKEGATAFAAGWVGERESRTETTSGKFAMADIPLHEMYAAPRASQTMLDDSAFNMEEWISRKLAQRFAILEGTAFVNGTGQNQPEGLLANADVTTVNSTVADNIAADSLITLVYSLPDAYARNATWLLRRTTVAAIRQLKDGNGQYLWQPGLATSAPNTILGHPYVECPDVPAIAANAYVAIFGDIRAAYQIVDKAGIVTLRDPYSAKPFVEFYTTRRVGGQVVLPEAVRKYRCHA